MLNPPMRYEVSGEDANVVSTADIIEQHLESMAGDGPHLISTSWAFQVIAAVILGVFSFYSVVYGFLSCWSILFEHKHAAFDSVEIGSSASAMLLMGGLTLLIVLINGPRLKRNFFPNGFFCIGDGEARYKRAVEWRKRLGWGALVSLAIGIIGKLIVSMFAH
jgi:hypothetical protein